MKNKLFALVAVFAVASMALSACGPAAAPATEAPTAAPAATEAAAACAPAVADWNPVAVEATGKSFNIAFEQEPDTAFGTFSNMSFAMWINQMMDAGLGKWDDKGNLVPYLATEIPSSENGGVSADGLTVTWKIKPCMFWSDGQPFTSKDIAFTWKANMDPGNQPISRDGYDKIKSVETPDDLTAVITFSTLYPSWPTLFTLGPNNGGGPIMPAHILEGQTAIEKSDFVKLVTVGAGPFLMKEWVSGDHMTLVANPNYSGDKPLVDVVNIKFTPDPEAALAALKAGDVDFVPNFAESDIETLKGLEGEGINMRVDPAPEFEHLFFNLGTTAGVDGVGKSDLDGFCPFQDPNVRKAIVLGIDRLSFIKNYLKEDEKAYIASLWPNSYWYNTSLTPYPYDQAQAAALLDAAGYPVGSDGIRAGTCNGQAVKFDKVGIETTTAQRRVDNVLAIQADLGKLGITIVPNHIPAGTFFGSYAEGADMPLGKFDMAIYTTGFYPDPNPGDSFMCKGVPSAAQPTGQNNYHVCMPEMDKLFDAGIASADPATRKVAYDAIQKYQYDNVIMIPLYARANVYAYSSKVTFPPSGGFSNAFWDMEYFDVAR